MSEEKQSLARGFNDPAAVRGKPGECRKDADMAGGAPDPSVTRENDLRPYLAAAPSGAPIAPQATPPEAPPAAPPTAPSAPAAPKRPRRLRLFVGIAAACLLAVAAVLILPVALRAPSTIVRDGLTFTRIGDTYVMNGVAEGIAVVEIPSRVRGLPVTGIGGGTFQQNKTVVSVSIPETVTRIGDYAFDGCDSLTVVTIPSSVEVVEDNAFRDCARLTIFCAMSESMETWGDWNPSGSPVTYIYPEKHTADGIIYEKRGDAYAVSGSERRITVAEIPDTVLGLPVTTVEPGAFKRRRSLVSVTVGDGVTTIGEAAFRGCRSLISVTLGNGVEEIGASAFYRCRSLISVTLGDHVESIGMRAFRGCRSLCAISFPDSVRTIGEEAFRRCTSLTAVTVGRGVEHIGSFAFDRCKRLASVQIPASVTRIDGGVFSKCTLLTIYCEAETIPEGWANGLLSHWNPNRRPVVWGQPIGE